MVVVIVIIVVLANDVRSAGWVVCSLLQKMIEALRCACSYDEAPRASPNVLLPWLV